MTKPLSGPLPAILKRRLNIGSSAEVDEDVFKALVEHYRLSEQHNETPREKMDPSRENAAATVSWRALARALMLDFIPAYQPKLRKADGHLLRDWMDAGGSVLNIYGHSSHYRRHFYQAQFVWLIQEQKRQKARSREWVFRWFAHEEEKIGPKERSRRTSLLPRPYRRRSTSESPRQAFNSIPKTVRHRSVFFLPWWGSARAPRSLNDRIGGGCLANR